jgi:conjugal transfer/entry exclusion protein
MEELQRLNEQIAELQQQAETLKADLKNTAIKEIKEAMALYGLTIKDIEVMTKKAKKKK